MAEKKARCLYCNNAYEFIAGSHLRRDDHFGDSNAFEQYKQWVANEFGLPFEHEVFDTPGALTRPNDFARYEHLFR